jgi:hypothetical protein
MRANLPKCLYIPIHIEKYSETTGRHFVALNNKIFNLRST